MKRRTKLGWRKRQVLFLVACGYTDAEIAEKLHIELVTVATHMRRIRRQLGVPTRAAAVSAALSRGLIRPPTNGEYCTRRGAGELDQP